MDLPHRLHRNLRALSPSLPDGPNEGTWREFAFHIQVQIPRSVSVLPFPRPTTPVGHSNHRREDSTSANAGSAAPERTPLPPFIHTLRPPFRRDARFGAKEAACWKYRAPNRSVSGSGFPPSRGQECRAGEGTEEGCVESGRGWPVPGACAGQGVEGSRQGQAWGGSRRGVGRPGGQPPPSSLV